MEYLKGTYDEISRVKDNIESGVGIDNESIIGQYADIIFGVDGSCAIPIIPEVRKFLNCAQIGRLISTLPDGYCHVI